MNNPVNNKRVFLVVPHVPAGYLDIVGRRDDVRLDKLENDHPSAPAKSVLAAAHAYQTSSTRDELAPVTPHGVFAVSQCDAFWIATIPGVLCQPNLLQRRN